MQRIKRMTIFAFLAVFSFAITVNTALVSQDVGMADQVREETVRNISRKDDTEWRYREIDGRLYKRLFNTTQQQWIGDWILC